MNERMKETWNKAPSLNREGWGGSGGLGWVSCLGHPLHPPHTLYTLWNRVQAQCLSAFRTLTPSNQKFPIQKKSCIPFQECSPSIEWNDEKNVQFIQTSYYQRVSKTAQKRAFSERNPRWWISRESQSRKTRIFLDVPGTCNRKCPTPIRAQR